MRLTPTSGHTIYAPHIEAPIRGFIVSWDSVLSETDEPGIHWEPTRRWAKVKAETSDGALKIAQWHYFLGRNFKLDQTL